MEQCLNILEKMLMGLLRVCTTGSFSESLAPNSEGSLNCISL